MDEQAEAREIDSVEQLRALADPVRLAIMTALDARGPGAELPILSVKELAHQLGEPQTKLYRHVKQLETAGLIHVAATRMVSGILEQRYQASQRSMHLSSTLARQHTDEATQAARSAFDMFLAGYFDRVREKGWPEDDTHKMTVLMEDKRVTPESAERIKARLDELFHELSVAEVGDVQVNLMAGFYWWIDTVKR
jgi:DNA-binding transcriptional ArsR family regulator